MAIYCGLRELQGFGFKGSGFLVVCYTRVPFGVLFIWVPYYLGDPERDPKLENYPYDK